MNRCVWLLVVILAPLTTGCPRERQTGGAASSGESPTEPRPSVTLRLVVVNEPDLAVAISRLRGEWADRSGGELTASSEPWQEVIAGKTIDADLIVFPSRYLGALCVRDWLRPVRTNVMESNALQTADYFPSVRHELISWGGEPMALPLGVDPMVVADRPAAPSGLALLAEAASQAMSRERLGMLFDTETMQPRIVEQPFIESLTKLVKSQSDESAALPADGRPFPILGYGDRLVAVTVSSKNAATAFKLLEWLALPETSTQLARSEPGTMPVRRSLASSPRWYDPALSASDRDSMADTLAAALSGERYLFVPRIPGVDEYLAALDQAVIDAVHDEVPPKSALEKAAQRWEEITDAHGRDAQRAAYLKHLGIAEP